jgi:3-hydroxyacyl-[acyl-carrier-protein] dehydratase
LPGHFPGNPIVPGVVLLNHVMDYAQLQFGAGMRICGIEQVKFLEPLRPGQTAQIELDLQTNQLRFIVRSSEETGSVIAQGILSITQEVAS